jgi:type I restriction enzyme S subunit
VNVKNFLENFRYVAEAPNGVDKLREMILDLAMQGRLVPQNPRDIPANELLQDIESEKRILQEQGSKTRPKKHAGPALREVPHQVPDTWKWVRFGDIANHNAGKTLDKARNSGHPRDYITTSHLYWGRFELGDVRQMLIRDDELERCTARKGDLLICEGGEAGRAAVWPYDSEICFQNHIHRARFYAGIDPYYAYRYLQKLNATGEINQYRKGVGISNMSGKALASIPFPLAPLAEQQRIVAKVDELMALCDKLEARQHRLTRLAPKLSRTNHRRLVERSSEQSLEILFESPCVPQDLISSIRSLAVRGKLTERVETDESAGALMERVSLQVLGQSKRTQHLTSSSTVMSSCFEIPSTWHLTKLEDLLIFGPRNGYSPKPVDYETLLRSLTLSATTSGRLLLQHAKFIDEEIPDDSFLWLTDGDILVQRANTIDYVGVSAVFRGPAKHFIYPDLMMKLRISDELNVDYINLVMSCEESRGFLRERATGTSGSMPKINQTTLRSLPIPVPPIEEQRRIVSRVAKLSALVDVLSDQIAAKAETASDFAKFAVAAITGTAPQEFEPMRAPRTELVTHLQVMLRNRQPGSSEPLATLLAEHGDSLSAKALWQRSGLAIDAFYQQLRDEMERDWIVEPEKARMREVEGG